MSAMPLKEKVLYFGSVAKMANSFSHCLQHTQQSVFDGRPEMDAHAGSGVARRKWQLAPEVAGEPCVRWHPRRLPAKSAQGIDFTKLHFKRKPFKLIFFVNFFTNFQPKIIYI
jgi:hypothetical protein